MPDPYSSRTLKNLKRGSASTPTYGPDGEELELALGVDPELPKAELVEKADDPVAMVATPPHEIPLSLMTLEARKDLACYLTAEIETAEGERQGLIDKLPRWEEAYRAKYDPDATKDFPFEGAANLTVPFIQEVVDVLVAGLRQTLLVPGPIWMLEDIANEWEVFTKRMEKFFTLAGERELKLNKYFVTYILDLVKYGTATAQVDHYYEEGLHGVYDRFGKKVALETRIKKSGPVFWNIPLQDFFIRIHETDVQEAEWCSKRLRLTGEQIKARVASGLFAQAPAERLMKHAWDWMPDEVREKYEELNDTEPVDRCEFVVHEVWHKTTLDGPKVKSSHADMSVECVGYLAPQTEEFLSERFNPHWHGERPFVKDVYTEIQYCFYGMGIPEKLEGIQVEISAQHNQRLDAGTVSNRKMLKVRRGSGAYRPGDPVYTGKVWFVKNMDDIEEFSLGEPAQSTIQNEGITRGYGERLSGVNEANSGGAMPVTRTTATAQIALLQEGARRRDQIIGNLRDTIGKIGEYMMSYYFQYGAGNKPLVWMGRDGAVLMKLFELPKRASELGLGIKPVAPTSQINKELQRQNTLAVYNVLSTVYEKLIQYIVQLHPEQADVAFGGLVVSASAYTRHILELFDAPNIDDVLSALAVLEKLYPQPEDAGGMNELTQLEARDATIMQLKKIEALLADRPGVDDARQIPPPREEKPSPPGAQVTQIRSYPPAVGEAF